MIVILYLLIYNSIYKFDNYIKVGEIDYVKRKIFRC